MLEILQKLGIVEKPLNQRPLEDKDPATLTHEEVLELLRRKEDMLRQQEVRQLSMRLNCLLTAVIGDREAHEEAPSTRTGSEQPENS